MTAVPDKTTENMSKIITCTGGDLFSYLNIHYFVF